MNLIVVGGALLAGLVLGDALRPDPDVLSRAALMGALLFPMTSRWHRGRWVGVVVMALALGAAAVAPNQQAASFVGPAPGRVLDIEGRLCGRPRWGQGILLCGTRSLRGPEAGPWPGQVWVAPQDNPGGNARLEALSPATRVQLRVRSSAFPQVRNPGQTDWGRIWMRRGISARVYLVHPLLLVEVGSAERPGWAAMGTFQSFWHRFRQRISEQLVSAGSGGALLAALSVGHRAGLSPESLLSFQRWGLSHLLAVSGLHVVLVGGLCFAGARRAGARISGMGTQHDTRRLAALASAFGALGYALMTGMGVPVFRALIAWCSFLASFALGRGFSSSHALALAGVVILVAEPGVAFELGAQLSFLATGALLIAGGSASSGSGLTGSVLSFLGRSCGNTAVVLAWTSPLLAWHGLMVSGWGLLANAVAVPVLAWGLLPCALAGSAWSVWGIQGEGPDWVLSVLALPADIFLAGLQALTEQWPAAGSRPSLSSLGMGMGMGLGSLIVAQRRTWVRVPAVVALVSWLGSGVGPALDPSRPRLVVLDVGQGDAILIQGRQADVLVDGGRARPGHFDQGLKVVVPALRALGVTDLDVVVATHADLDHRGGLESVLRTIPTGQLWLPEGSRGDPGFEQLTATAQARGVQVLWLAASGAARLVGQMKWDVLWPPEHAASLSRNDGSLVLRGKIEGHSILLTGDIGVEVEEKLLRSGRAL
ncbi:MAG: ComEC/Rec2 family competence protein [Myxococcota bacterium]|nr:ComEC/Rec2 family competence protein [Myxococcota bacterium]